MEDNNGTAIQIWTLLLMNKRANGKYSFITEGLYHQLNVSENALKSLQRLKNREAVVMIRKGFYVIVPPEYRVRV